MDDLRRYEKQHWSQLKLYFDQKWNQILPPSQFLHCTLGFQDSPGGVKQNDCVEAEAASKGALIVDQEVVARGEIDCY